MCHFAAFLKPFCVLSQKHAHTRIKQALMASVSLVVPLNSGNLCRLAVRSGFAGGAGNSTDKTVVKGFLSGSRDEEILHSKET